MLIEWFVVTHIKICATVDICYAVTGTFISVQHTATYLDMYIHINLRCAKPSMLFTFYLCMCVWM